MTFNKSAAVFVPGNNGSGDDVVASSPALTFNPEAKIFVPGQGEVDGALEESLDCDTAAEPSVFNVSAPVFVPGGHSKEAVVVDDAAAAAAAAGVQPSRARLSSHAAAFVPCWGAACD